MNCTNKDDSYLSLKSSVSDIAEKYFRCLQNLSEGKPKKNSFSIYIKRVKDAYAKLDHLEQRFINNEFFYQDYPNWWKDKYCKSTFYRIKKQSMKDFLEAFNNAT